MKTTAGLQTGNLIFFNGLVHQLQTVGQWLHTDRSVDEIPLDQCSPIPLTEDWLVETGYKRSSFNMINVTDTCIIDPEGKTIGFYSDYHEEDITFKLPEYVHQLQNLFFVLTQDQLCITQP